MRLRNALLVLVAALVVTTSCAKKEDDWGDPLAAFSFTEPATDPQAKVIPFPEPQTSEERAANQCYVRCHFMDVARSSDPDYRQKWRQFTYQAKQGPGGLQMATVGNEAQFAPLARWRRLTQHFEFHVFVFGNDFGEPNYMGQYSADTPGISAQVQPLDSGRLRVVFKPYPYFSPTMPTATLAQSMLTVDVEPAVWVVIPCELHGISTGSSPEKVCDRLMFLSVTQPYAKQRVVNAGSNETTTDEVVGDSTDVTPGGAH